MDFAVLYQVYLLRKSSKHFNWFIYVWVFHFSFWIYGLRTHMVFSHRSLPVNNNIIHDFTCDLCKILAGNNRKQHVHIVIYAIMHGIYVPGLIWYTAYWLPLIRRTSNTTAVHSSAQYHPGDLAKLDYLSTIVVILCANKYILRVYRTIHTTGALLRQLINGRLWTRPMKLAKSPSDWCLVFLPIARLLKAESRELSRLSPQSMA